MTALYITNKKWWMKYDLYKNGRVRDTPGNMRNNFWEIYTVVRQWKEMIRKFVIIPKSHSQETNASAINKVEFLICPEIGQHKKTMFTFQFHYRLNFLSRRITLVFFFFKVVLWSEGKPEFRVEVEGRCLHKSLSFVSVCLCVNEPWCYQMNTAVEVSLGFYLCGELFVWKGNTWMLGVCVCVSSPFLLHWARTLHSSQRQLHPHYAT